jgi:hypothetical protein
VAAIVPPVLNGIETSNISKNVHVVNLTPSVLANPAITTTVIAISKLEFQIK